MKVWVVSTDMEDALGNWSTKIVSVFDSKEKANEFVNYTEDEFSYWIEELDVE